MGDDTIKDPSRSTSALPRRLIAILFVARLVLWLEAIWSHAIFWLGSLLLGAGAGLLGVPDYLPWWGHALVLALWGGLVGFSSWRLVRHIRQHPGLPPLADAIRMLEQRQQIPHRALSTFLLDRPSQTDRLGLWQHHLNNLRPVLARLRMPVPNPDMPGHDPYALRFVPVLLCLIGFVVAGPHPFDRILRWVNPGEILLDTAPVLMLDAWITPPDYTGLPPIMLSQGAHVLTAADTPLRIPVNSVFHGRVTASRHAPRLVLDERTGLVFQHAGDQSFQLEAALSNTRTLSIRRGHRDWISWPVTSIPDTPPVLERVAVPRINKKQQIVLDYLARDDYGLAGLEAQLTLMDKIEDTETPPPHIVALGGNGQKEQSGPTALDLLAHPWAGLAVSMTLTARDTPGQTTISPSVSVTLPHRAFSHPTARLLIDWRRELTLWPRSKRTTIADNLADLAAKDETLQAAPARIIALAGLNRQLRDPDHTDAIAYAQDLLWQIALSIDQSQLAERAQQLAAAQKELEQALQNPDARAETLDPLIDALEQALHQLQASIIEDLKARLARGEALPTLPPDAEHMVLDPGAIADMIRQMRNQTDTGARDQARQMLAQMGKMLEQLQNGMIAGNDSPTPDPSTAGKMQKFFDDLTSTLHQQQMLARDLARTQPEKVPGLKPRQDTLRERIGNAMLQSDDVIGIIPPELGEIDQAMRTTGQALQAGRQGYAIISMQETLDALERVIESLESAQAGAQSGFGLTRPGSGAGAGTGVARPTTPAPEQQDPLGRDITRQGTADDPGVKVQGSDENSLARDILDELRRRANGRHRPESERNYLQRLLDQF